MRNLQNEDWARFLPKFKKTNQKKKEKKDKKKDKKKYTPFPPPQQPSKIDLQLESGEYFLSEEQKKKRVAEERAKEKRAKQGDKVTESNKKFIAPAEPVSFYLFSLSLFFLMNENRKRKRLHPLLRQDLLLKLQKT